MLSGLGLLLSGHKEGGARSDLGESETRFLEDIVAHFLTMQSGGVAGGVGRLDEGGVMGLGLDWYPQATEFLPPESCLRC